MKIYLRVGATVFAFILINTEIVRKSGLKIHLKKRVDFSKHREEHLHSPAPHSPASHLPRPCVAPRCVGHNNSNLVE